MVRLLKLMLKVIAFILFIVVVVWGVERFSAKKDVKDEGEYRGVKFKRGANRVLDQAEMCIYSPSGKYYLRRFGADVYGVRVFMKENDSSVSLDDGRPFRSEVIFWNELNQIVIKGSETEVYECFSSPFCVKKKGEGLAP